MILRYLTVIVGATCAVISFSLFGYFIQSKKGIGKSVAYMLLAESIAMSITVMFSVFAEGIFDSITPGQSMLMRWVMFGCQLCSSLHLAYHTNQILQGNE